MSGALAFGVVKLGDLEVAIDAQALEQVINWPSRLQPHPLQGGALLGMFSPRGMALPLIELRSLLGEHDVSRHDPLEMVAIVNLFAGVVGLENGEQALLLDYRELLERTETLSFAKI